MHKRFVCSPALALLLALAWPAALAAQAPTAQSDEAVLRHFKTVLWPDAYATQNLARLDSMLAPTYEVVDAQGRRDSKAAELAWLRANKVGWTRFQFAIERLEIYGAVALVAGVGTVASPGPAGEKIYRYWSSNWFVKTDGRWRAVYSQTSGELKP